MHSKNQRRHGSPSSSRGPLVPMKAKMPLSQSEVEPLQFRVPRDYPHSRFNKAPLAVYPPKGARAKACVSLPVVSLEKMPCFNRSEAAHFKVNSAPSAVASSFSTPSSTSASSSSASSSFSLSSSSSSSSLKSPLVSMTSHKNQEKLTNGRGPTTPRSSTPPTLMGRRPSPSPSPLDKRHTPSPSAQDRRPSTSPSPSSLDRRNTGPPSPPDRKHPNGAKGTRHRRVSGRIFDPNKHCGVVDPESKRPCTRSLTCKTHSLTHRRAVPGRRKDFDILLAEHKGRAKEKETGQKKEAVSSQSAPSEQSLEASSCVPPSCYNGKATPTIKLRLANPHVQRVSGGGGAVVLSSTPVQVPAPDTMPSWQRYGGDAHVSSDEGEAELAEDTEKPSCHYSPYHPRPMSWCAFSSRLMGRGHYVFDRRWDRMRLALHCMVEKHVNAQMWRKVPLMADGPASVSPSPVEASSPLSSPVVSLTLSPALDSVSVVSYSAPFSHNGSGIFCIRDPDPSPRGQPAKPAKSARASTEAPVKRRKRTPSSEAGACRKNGNGYQPPPGPTHISNGTAALSVRPKPRPGGQGPRDSDRYVSVELTLPQALTGDHGGVSSHAPLAYGSAEGRKRKTSSSGAAGDRAGKVTKTKALDGIFRKGSAALLGSVSEASHRLPKVQQ